MGKTIILTGGGTAGHVTPNMALIPLLLEDGWTIHYIGSHQGIEKELIAQFPQEMCIRDRSAPARIRCWGCKKSPHPYSLPA